jgi:hypothetical protein
LPAVLYGCETLTLREEQKSTTLKQLALAYIITGKNWIQRLVGPKVVLGTLKTFSNPYKC